MSNVLSEEKRQQVIALGRLGWPLRRIEQETGVRRETAGGYLRAAGIGVRPPRGWGRRPPSKPANEVTTGSDVAKPAMSVISDPNRNPETPSHKGTSKSRNLKTGQWGDHRVWRGLERLENGKSQARCVRQCLRTVP
jgi:hypothetical protein